MKMIEEIRQLVAAGVTRVFPGYPVAIHESPEDSATLWVQVFGVPSDTVRAVKNAIHVLQQELPADADVLLLPMVKNLEITRQYYPQYLPPEAEPVAVPVLKYFHPCEELKAWKRVSLSSLLIERQHLTLIDDALILDGADRLKPRSPCTGQTSANNEMALAA